MKKIYKYHAQVLQSRISDTELDLMGKQGWLLVSETYQPRIGWTRHGYGNSADVPYEFVYRFVKEEIDTEALYGAGPL